MENNKKATFAFFAAILAIICLTGCSATMALAGRKDSNRGALYVGQHRDEVITLFKKPIKSIETDNGRIDVFALQKGNAPSAGRAVGHLFMDAITWGAWEIAGTMTEAGLAKKIILTVEYDANDKVKDAYEGEPKNKDVELEG